MPLSDLKLERGIPIIEGRGMPASLLTLSIGYYRKTLARKYLEIFLVSFTRDKMTFIKKLARALIIIISLFFAISIVETQAYFSLYYAVCIQENL